MRSTIASRRLPLLAGALTCAATLLVGCSTTDHLEEFNQIQMGNAAPAQSPDAADPTGTVVPVAGSISTVLPLDDGTIAIQTTDSPAVLIGSVADGSFTEEHSVEVPANSGSMAPGANGTVLVPTPEGLLRISADGKADTVGDTGAVTAVAELSDGRLLTGAGDGTVQVRDAAGAESKRLPSLAGIDQLAAVDNRAVALSRADTVVANVYPDESEIGPNLRGGKASGTIAVSPQGWIAVSDTTGNALQIFSTDPVRLHQYFPVGKAPWAVTVDPESQLVWVTLTAENRVAAYDISSGSGEEVASLPTLAQPDAIALSRSGDLLVGSGAGKGLQIIPQAELAAG